MGVYLDREALEILDEVRESLARQLGVRKERISRSMAVKYLYHLSKPFNSQASLQRQQ
ncbi:hypothetical protein [Thermococcus nautili]|uniref:Putative DNA-binding protein n=1 Tax=Thermococcus nautili TaxID=195522 RepID=U3RHP1_9EURY|nr:hypothetical protein [Thermococcus nautili]AGX15343.1 Putative DNA-binding protein [Thermococcus nautili]AHL23870.1 Putative DNA-binding protein [Thermococcus nautili]CAI1492056.1 Putative DNA-binding protein [Thermococcus nautili]